MIKPTKCYIDKELVARIHTDTRNMTAAEVLVEALKHPVVRRKLDGIQYDFYVVSGTLINIETK